MRQEWSCVSFMKNGKCPKNRWNTHRCPFSVIPQGQKECMYYGGQKELTKPIDITNKSD